jgi:hypothetical protein
VKRSAFSALCLLIILPACRGGKFTNLGFEDADTEALPVDGSGMPYGFGPIDKLLPGWTLYHGTNLFNGLYVNEHFDPSFDLAQLGGGGVLGPVVEGRFALELFRADTNSLTWIIEQTGTVPPDAQFLAFRTVFNPMQVQINGEAIPALNPVGSLGLQGYTGSLTNLVYDVSQFAGQEVTLRSVGPVLEEVSFFPPSGGTAYIDSIRFVTPPPVLTVTASGSQLIISWPANAVGYVLQTSDSLSLRTSWQSMPTPPMVVVDQQSVAITIQSKVEFYRLGLSCERCG